MILLFFFYFCMCMITLELPFSQNSDDDNRKHFCTVDKNKLGYPRLVLERLPENVVNNVVNKSFSTAQDENEAENTDTKDSGRKCFSQYYRKYCTNCEETASLELKRRNCKNCNIQFNYECKRCSKKFPNYTGIVCHLKVKCIEKGNYYKCSKCNYKSIDKYEVSAHLKSIHSVLDSLDHIEKFEEFKSENVQKDVMSSANSHRCSKCGKQFQRLPPLLIHIQICGQAKSNAKHFTATVNAVQDKCLHHCVKCNQTVKHDKVGSFYQKKCRNCHSKFSFKCKKCDKIFNSYTGMSHHFKVNHTVSNDVFKCPECDYKAPFVHFLTRHVRRTHILETHECMKCGQKYRNRNAFKTHSLHCKKEPQFECDYCSHKTKTKMSLKLHISRVHTKGTAVECPQCGTTLKNKPTLNAHLRYCQEEPHHECNLCQFKTKFKHDLTAHCKNVHSKEQKNEICSHCAKECKNMNSLRSHQRYCGKSPNLSCNFCCRTFKYKTSLTLHINRKHQEYENVDHTHNFVYLHCDDCTYKSKFKGDLVKHVITHMEDNVKKCPICKKHFKTEYFKRHAKFCGRDALRCHLCKYQTYTKDCLKRHIVNIHAKGNEIDCSKCGRTCKNKIYLRSHLQRCGTKPHLQCDDCSYKTKYKYTLRKHIEKFHTKKDIFF